MRELRTRRAVGGNQTEAFDLGVAADAAAVLIEERGDGIWTVGVDRNRVGGDRILRENAVDRRGVFMGEHELAKAVTKHVLERMTGNTAHAGDAAARIARFRSSRPLARAGASGAGSRAGCR